MTALSKALTTDKINRLMSVAILSLAGRKARTNESEFVQSHGFNLEFKLIGFNPDYQRVIMQVIINKVPVEKVILDKAGEYYHPHRQVDYAAGYLKALRVVPVKNVPVMP